MSFGNTRALVQIPLALYNPILLVGLPLPEKFGMNPPFSGFYEQGESDLLWELLPEKYQPFFREVWQSDAEVLSLIQWFDSLPTLTKEESEESVRQFERTFRSDLGNHSFEGERGPSAAE